MAVVTLDAGHGGYDNGASYQGRKEKDDNLNLALAVGNILQNEGVDVRYTRTEDVYQTPQRKAEIANENDSDLFISIHRNSSPSPNQYSGIQTLVYADSGPRRLLAQNINSELEKAGFTNLGISVRKDLPVIRQSNMPAGLVEVGFINTDRDNALLDRSEEHTSELQSRPHISYAVFCLKKNFFNDTATTEIYTLSLHDALPIYRNNLVSLKNLLELMPKHGVEGINSSRFKIGRAHV